MAFDFLPQRLVDIVFKAAGSIVNGVDTICIVRGTIKPPARLRDSIVAFVAVDV